MLKDRELGPLQGFISKLGRPFAAILRIDGDHRLAFDFGQREEEDTEPVDFSALTPIGACPKCKSRVFEHGMHFVCEKSVGPEKTCDFRTGKVILQQEISAEQVAKLLASGKTDLLENFISSRTNRKFKAYLSVGEGGKVGFEFEAKSPRAGKVANKAAAKKATKAASKTAATPKKAAKKAAKKAVKKAVKKVAKKAAKTAGTD